MRVHTDIHSELSQAEVAFTGLDNCELLLVTAIDEISKERVEITSLADASYLHPNGFTRIRLPFTSEVGGGLYLNVWQPGVAESDVHDHAFDFLSTVLSGSLRHRRWSEATLKQGGTEGSLYLHDRGNTEASTGKAQLKRLGRAVRKMVDEITFEPGDAYFLEHTQPHTVTPDATLVTRTLVHQTPDMSLTTTVFRPNGAEREQTIYKKLTPPEYVGELQTALASLTVPARVELVSAS